MASARRSMLMFRPSSSTCRFSSRVPKSVSMLGLISILFFIQFSIQQAPVHPPAQLRGFRLRLLDVTSRIGGLFIDVPLRIVLRHMGWAGNSSVKSVPREIGGVNRQENHVAAT